MERRNVNSLQKDFKKLLSPSESTSSSSSKADSSGPRYGFDEYVEIERRKFNFSSHLHFRQEVKFVLIRFYHFYFGCKIDKEDDALSIVLDMIALSRTDNGFIWPAKASMQKGFYPPNSSTPLELKCSLVTTDFYHCVKTTIEAIDVSEQASQDEKFLLKLSGFLAMTLLRFVNKNLNYMRNLFQEDDYKNNLKSVLQLGCVPFHPPCGKCLVMCSKLIISEKVSISGIYIVLVHEYKLSKKSGRPGEQVEKYLAASVLDDTAFHGLGMIELLNKVCEITQKKKSDIMKETYQERTSESWNEIKEFFKNQLKEGDEQVCYPWARIIDNTFFQGLCPKQQNFLATMLARVIEKVEGPGIWNSEWAKDCTISKFAIELGDMLFEKYCPEKLPVKSARSRRLSRSWLK